MASSTVNKVMNAVRKESENNSWHNAILTLLPRLKRYAFSLTGSVADAEDLLQSTLEKALARSTQFQQGSELDRWMFRICRNLWLDSCRARKVRAEIGPLEESGQEPRIDGEEQTIASITLQETASFLAAMPAEQRELLLLAVVEGYSYKEVADQLEIPIGTVMSRLARARAKLAALAKSGPRPKDNVVPISQGKLK